MVDDVVGTTCCGVVANNGENRRDSAIGTTCDQLRQYRRRSSLVISDIIKMWKPPWTTATRSLRPLHHHHQRHRQHANMLSSNLPGFKKNNAVFILIYFGLIFTFLLSNLSSASSIADTSTTSTTTSTKPSTAQSTTRFSSSTSSSPSPTAGAPSLSADGHFHSDLMAEGAIIEQDFLSEEPDDIAESETRLHRTLMESYSRDARPSKISNVSMHIQLISLDDVQESGHIILTVQIWMTWRDMRFRWSPSNYSGVVNLQILPVDRIWFPLFWIRNSAQPDIQNSFWSHFPAFIGWTGIVSWVSSGKITVACDLDFFYYPSDSQTCAIQFAAHDSYHINLTSRDERRPVCFDRYTNNSLWEITGVRAVPSGMTVHRTNEYLSFQLRLRRKPLTDILRIFLPTACLAIVSLIAFLLPPDSGDKLNVTFSTMMAFFVMFLAITDIVPFTAEHTPIMTYFVVCTLLLSTIETTLCAVIMTIADTEKARESAAAAAACEASSRKSSVMLQHLTHLAKQNSLAERRGSVLGYTWSEQVENVGTGHPGESESFLGNSCDDMRPRSFSNSTTSSSITDSGIIDLSGGDAALITALKSKQQRRKSSSTSSAVLIGRNIDGPTPTFIRSDNKWYRRVGIFLIRLWRRFLAFARRSDDFIDSDDSSELSVGLPQGLVSSKRLNLFSFFIFGAIKIFLISLVSVILYDQSRAEDVEAAGFYRPEYSDCWQ